MLYAGETIAKCINGNWHSWFGDVESVAPLNSSDDADLVQLPDLEWVIHPTRYDVFAVETEVLQTHTWRQVKSESVTNQTDCNGVEHSLHWGLRRGGLRRRRRERYKLQSSHSTVAVCDLQRERWSNVEGSVYTSCDYVLKLVREWHTYLCSLIAECWDRLDENGAR